MLPIWAEFIFCVLVIGVAGVKLSRFGDIIAEKTDLGGTWIGIILLATVTSMPELFTGVSAVTFAQVPNIAIGDALGSCVFNLVMIVFLDFMHRGESVYTRASQGHILSAAFTAVLIGLVGFSVLLGPQAARLSVGHVGSYSLAIVILYAVAMRTVFRYERRQIAEFVEEMVEQYPHISLRQASWGYALFALIVVGMGIWLPFIGAQLAEVMGWNNTFVGTLLVAFATSVPELVVTTSALHIGALDMAIANLFGSNLFDILIVAVDDLFFLPGPILAYVDRLHAASAFSAVMMTGVAIIGLLYRPSGRVLKTVGWASLMLFCIYLMNGYVLYLLGA